jgi:hypothetical protein
MRARARIYREDANLSATRSSEQIAARDQRD